MKNKELEVLIFNPFYTANILHHFMSGVQSINNTGIKLELINIVLPIIFEEKLAGKNCLLNLTKDSQTNKLLENPYFKFFISNINERIKNFKNITNNSLLVLSTSSEIIFGSFIAVKEVIDYKKEIDPSIREIYRASFNLGVILAKKHYNSIFLQLKITEL